MLPIISNTFGSIEWNWSGRVAVSIRLPPDPQNGLVSQKRAGRRRREREQMRNLLHRGYIWLICHGVCLCRVRLGQVCGWIDERVFRHN